MIKLKKLVIFFAGVLFTTCGVQEIYYLPQVLSNIGRDFNTEARITIPSISQYYYARGYRIFYRIYISDHPTTSDISGSPSDRSSISSTLVSDYNYFASLTDSTNTASVPNINTFRNRSYYELEFEGIRDITSVLTTAGGNVTIRFLGIIGERPVLIINGKEYILSRSNGGGTFSPVPEDRYFFSSPELNAYGNANSEVNADVAGRSGVSQYAYVCMYIVATGQNPTNFTRIYSKPTLISIFRLPDRS